MPYNVKIPGLLFQSKLIKHVMNSHEMSKAKFIKFIGSDSFLVNLWIKEFKECPQHKINKLLDISDESSAPQVNHMYNEFKEIINKHEDGILYASVAIRKLQREYNNS